MCTRGAVNEPQQITRIHLVSRYAGILKTLNKSHSIFWLKTGITLSSIGPYGSTVDRAEVSRAHTTTIEEIPSMDLPGMENKIKSRMVCTVD